MVKSNDQKDKAVTIRGLEEDIAMQTGLERLCMYKRLFHSIYEPAWH
jgi:hypothetical protein